MKKFALNQSTKTPLVDFDYDGGVLQLKGRSILEDSVEFYRPIQSWVEEYTTRPRPQTKVDLALEYFNTNSSKQIMDFFKKLEDLNSTGSSNVEINWFYEENDIDMMETGEDFSQIFNLPIKTIPVERFEF